MDARSDVPLLPTLRHDPEADRALRDSLRVLRDHAEDQNLRERIDHVLSGRASLRDLARSEEFAAFVGPHAEQGLRDWEADQPSTPP